jgi:phosphatidylglycerophosphate synthase
MKAGESMDGGIEGRMRRTKRIQVGEILSTSSETVVSISVFKKRMNRVRPHRRLNGTLLGPPERAALLWLAAHLPAWVTPDHLTLVGFASAVMIFASYLLTNRSPAFLWLASCFVVLNWFGDSLDGTLARYRKIERPKYGYFVDHSIDALNEVLMFLGAGLSPYLHFEIAALALVGYLLLSVHVFLSTYVLGEFRLSFSNLGPTEVRVMVIAANTAVFFAGRPMLTLADLRFTLFDLMGCTLAVLFFAAFVVHSLRAAAALARAEKKPARPD